MELLLGSGARPGRNGYPAARRCRNSYTSWVSTPGKVPGGSAASRCECTRALGQACPPQRSTSSAGGRRQHVGSGQRDTVRRVVSPPRNQRACWYGVPTVTENSPERVDSTCTVHQYVPLPVSVNW